MNTASPSGIDRLILQAATGSRSLASGELRAVLEHVARVEFDPDALEEVRGRLAGIVWNGRLLRGSDRLPPVEVKCLWHVLTLQEWPLGTSLDGYVQSIQRVVLDPTSGVFVGRYRGAWQLSVVRDVGHLRGPGGSSWILVEYRVAIGHWVTAYQPRVAVDEELSNPNREDIRWLRRQQPANG
jgi:hypothetical protein